MSGQLLPSIYNMILISGGEGGHGSPADEKADIINQALYLSPSFFFLSRNNNKCDEQSLINPIMLPN